MQILHTEGVILKVIDFRDYDQIMTVFTPERGIVKWIFKKGKPAQGKPHNKISALARGEFVYSESKGEIWKCREISIFNHYLKLRENYAWLQAAGNLIQWILISQVEQKPAPKLYRLLISYLEKIPLTTNLPSLQMSFIIHLLKHEGLINFDLHCSLCQKPLRSLNIAHGNHFCNIHAPVDSLIFNEDETLAWMQTAACKTFSELQAVSMPDNFLQKAETLFKILMQ